MDRRALLALLASSPLAAAAAAPEQRSRPKLRKGEKEALLGVLRAARAFDLGGGYDARWGGSGTPETIEHEGERILSAAGPEVGTYCCGFTFALAMRVVRERGLLRGKSVADVRRFQKEWYGATAESKERLCALAVETLGVGRSVTADEAQAGDFCQIWRATEKPSGHSVLFLGWVEVGGERVGLSYLSSQGSTDGVGYGTEFVADAGIARGRVDLARTYFARLAP